MLLSSPLKNMLLEMYSMTVCCKMYSMCRLKNGHRPFQPQLLSHFLPPLAVRFQEPRRWMAR